MSQNLDPEYLAAIEPYIPILSQAPKASIGDVTSRRANLDGLFDMLMEHWPEVDDVERSNFTVQSSDGHSVPVHKFVPTDSSSGPRGDQGDVRPAVLYCHGGAYFSLSVEHYRRVIEIYVSRSRVPIFAVEYRQAPEHPFPAPLEDCYAALDYLSQHASDFQIDPSRIAVLGDSAGGGLAAAVAIKARDQQLNPPLAKQMLIGAMLDDRTTGIRHPAINSLVTWTDDDNLTGWQAYLGADKVDAETGLHPHAVPARCEEVTGLPPLYLEVPFYDIFRDENLVWAARMAGEGISTELHCWSGVPHSFELYAPRIETARIALDCRVKCMKQL
ncbi:hypothetical protein K431DRAFT_321819 [Polychaeton citri CBS 116435]|uniref:Alpha/beta hydrolase fold-3 domain-containing protein n=1 Tax=Polychaeton citri CBS 116435 TaxID=1314669 RepID=A0A9P4Q3T8_9PEZI|nr:hypothetical protein K431DRAFT_321819 [Polychaeton citri CBS 116435]